MTENIIGRLREIALSDLNTEESSSKANKVAAELPISNLLDLLK